MMIAHHTEGPKKHLKRLNAPKHWMLDKLGGTWATRPSTGPHKLRECLPLTLILKNRLKYALNRKEVMSIVMRRLVAVDHKVRSDMSYPAGFQGTSYRSRKYCNSPSSLLPLVVYFTWACLHIFCLTPIVVPILATFGLT